MYKLQKVRSRKLVHDISSEYRQRLARTILALRKKAINTITVLKSDDIVDDLATSSIQKTQNIEFPRNSSLENYDRVDSIEPDNLNDSLDSATVHIDNSEESETSSIHLDEEISFEKRLASVF